MGMRGEDVEGKGAYKPGRLRRIGGRGLIAAAALLLAALAGAPSASGYVYWPDRADLNDVTIARANLDGSGVNTDFITGAARPQGVAVDGAYVYWADGHPTMAGEVTGTVGRANLDGSGVNNNFLISSGLSSSVTVDSAHLYWANGMFIGRANIDGGGADPYFISSALSPTSVAVDGAHVYWASNDGTFHAIGRSNLDGSGVDTSFIPSADYIHQVAVDEAHIYWAHGNWIGRANLDGTDANPNFIGAIAPLGVAVDASHVYWGNADSAIGRANLDGSGVDQSFIAGVAPGGEIAVDSLGPGGGGGGGGDTNPPETTIYSGPRSKTTKRTATFTFVSDEAGSTFRCTLDGRTRECDQGQKTYRHLALGRHHFSVAATDAAGNTDPSPATYHFRVVRG